MVTGIASFVMVVCIVMMAVTSHAGEGDET